MKINSTLIHPDYNRQENDIALLKLSEDLIFNEFIQPITLPDHNYDELIWLDTKNTKYFIAGWGKAIKNVTKEMLYLSKYFSTLITRVISIIK